MKRPVYKTITDCKRPPVSLWHIVTIFNINTITLLLLLFHLQTIPSNIYKLQ